MAAESLTMKQVEVLVRGAKAEVKLMKVGRSEREEYLLRVALDQGAWKMSR